MATDTTAAPNRRLRAAAALTFPFAAGMAAALGLEPFNTWWATPAALGLAIWHISRIAAPRRAGRQALLLGAGYFGAGLSWIVDPFLVNAAATGWMAPFALLLMALGGGLFWAIPTAIAVRAVRWNDPRPRAAAIALALLLAEWLRGFIFTGFPWALPGQAWLPTPVAQTAAWWGQLGLTALTLAIAALPAVTRRKVTGLAFGVLVVIACWIGGGTRLTAPSGDTGLTLRLVQPNADQALKWDPVWAAEFYRRLLALSAGPTSDGKPRPDAVIWPETAVSFLLNEAGPALPEMAAAAGGAPLITGIQRAEDARWFNSLIELRPDASVGTRYDKFHLVPFGEYIPWGDALQRFGIRAFAAQAGYGYTPGPGPQVLSVAGLPPFQPLICYEAIFPQHLRNLDTRPGWLLQITNDAWFGRFSGPWQHLAQARLRAIETGLPMMRAANTGISAAIDPQGRLLARLDLGLEGRIDAVLPAALPPTLWLRWGNAPLVWAALAMLVGTVLFRPPRRWRRGRIDAVSAGT